MATKKSPKVKDLPVKKSGMLKGAKKAART
jgi:hypothetical protein